MLNRHNLQHLLVQLFQLIERFVHRGIKHKAHNVAITQRLLHKDA